MLEDFIQSKITEELIKSPNKRSVYFSTLVDNVEHVRNIVTSMHYQFDYVKFGLIAKIKLTW